MPYKRFWILLLGLAIYAQLPLSHAKQAGAQLPRSGNTGSSMERTVPADAPGLEPFPIEGERFRLKVAMEATDVGGSTSEIGSAWDSTTHGGQAAIGVGVSRGLCAGYTGPLDRTRENQDWIAHDWEVVAEVVDARTDRFTFDLDWVRWDRDSDGNRIRGRGDTRRLTLREHDGHILDFVEVTEIEDAQHCNTNVVIRIEVSIAEDPELADTELMYDLWFVERDGDDVVDTSRAAMPARQGQEATIEFSDLRHDLGSPAAGSPFVVAELGANVIGRARHDGSIDLSVAATRWFRVGYPTYEPVGGIGASGRLYVNVQPGEVVELTMPPSEHGSSLNYRDPETYVRSRDLREEREALLQDPGWDGTLVTDDATLVHYGRFFRDRGFSLMISARVESP